MKNTVYRVVKDGEEVWTTKTAGYEGVEVFPAEYLGNPETGVVQLIVDDEVIGEQRPIGHFETEALRAAEVTR